MSLLAAAATVVVPSMIGVIVSDRRIDDAGVDHHQRELGAPLGQKRRVARPATGRWRCATVNLFVPARSRRAPIGKNSATSSCRSVAALPLITVKRHCTEQMAAHASSNDGHAPAVIAASGSRRHDDGSAAPQSTAPQPPTGVVGARVVGVVAASALGVGANETERETKRHSTRREMFRVVVGEKGR